MKILFIFGSPVSFEVFSESGITDTFKNEVQIHSITIALRSNSKRTSPDKEALKDRGILLKEFLGSEYQDKIFSLLRDYAFIKKRKTSIAFSRRLSRKFFGNYQVKYLGSKAVINISKINLKNPINFLLMIAYIPFLSTIVEFLLKRVYPFPTQLESICKEISPDRIILMSTGMEPCLFEIPLVAKKLGFQWDLIVDNWDNLSSKTIFWDKPKHIFVWGKDHLNSAINQHGFLPSQISEIGTPRICFPTISYKANVQDKFVLYAGMQKPYDENSDLRVILDFCSSENCELIYRPHPMKKFNSSEREQLKLFSQEKNFHFNFSENFINLIPNSSLRDIAKFDEFTLLSKENLLSLSFRDVIVTPTSLALEALIYENPVIMMARDDGVHKTTSSTYWDLYSYFDPLKKISGVRVARNHQDLISFLKNHKERIFEKQYSKFIRDEICKSGKEMWAENLVKEITTS